MDKELFTSVDNYIDDLLGGDEDFLDDVKASIRSADMPEISVSRAHGRFLHLLARLCKARRILEIGTLVGYSTIWLARALPPSGKLITLEIDSSRAEVARENLERAGLSEMVTVRVGDAADTLSQLASEQIDPFDLIFIDADKQGYPTYLERSLELSVPGTIIIADNVVRNGKVVDGDVTNESILGIRRFNKALATTPELSKSILQTVGTKGHDGLAFAVVEESGKR